MGLIKSEPGALGSTLADQWKEFFYCESMDKNVMVRKGIKRVSGCSSDTKENDNIISSGFVITVADGQCMLIVEQGKVVEVCAEPGKFIYDSSLEPSVFIGKLDKRVKETFRMVGKRFSRDNDTEKEQRVYYFNIKELIENKFNTPNPIPCRVVDSKIGLDIDALTHCSGVYSYKIADPLLFYATVCGNVEREYLCKELENQLNAKLVSELILAFGKLSELELSQNQILTHASDIEATMNETLSKSWGELRGLEIVSIAINEVTLSQKDTEIIKQAQRIATMHDPKMAATALILAQADAMKSVVSKKASAITDFVKTEIEMNSTDSDIDAQNLSVIGQQQTAQQLPAQGSWKCVCGAMEIGKFCTNCGAKKTLNSSPYRCNKCGWEPDNLHKPPKFCAECGNPFYKNNV
ncbi:MAG: SPFH domain-containing protein [Clostridia bacterium]|nr:SPFH domain-containing protein [Clostridia bacterium]